MEITHTQLEMDKPSAGPFMVKPTMSTVSSIGTIIAQSKESKSNKS